MTERAPHEPRRLPLVSHEPDEVCPVDPAESDELLPRRRFLHVMGALVSMGAACTKQPEERIVPYVKAPEDVVAGRPLFYASAAIVGGVATGVLVEQNEGRPTKIEGNPEHPASLGATDAATQAATFDLYDPDRSKTLLHLGEIASYNALVGELQRVALKHRSKHGEGLRILTGGVGSPTLFAQIQELLAANPLAKWHWYEPVARSGARLGAGLAFGASEFDAAKAVDLEPRYDLFEADVIVALDADLFGTAEGRLAYARQFTARRNPERAASLGARRAGNAHPSRLYVFEPTPSITGTRADHRFAVRASDIEGVARAIAARLGVDAAPADLPAGVRPAVLDAIVKDLQRSHGASVVIAGDFQPPSVHALAYAINDKLGNVGTTVLLAAPALLGPADPIASLRELVADIDAGKVETLLILGGNPAYDTPSDLALADRLSKVALTVHLGGYDDETAGRCHWHVPAAHWLESWGDGRAFDGTVTLLQPLISPLYGGKTAHDLLVAISDRVERTTHDVVRARFGRDEAAWRRALHDGVAELASPPVPPLKVRSLKSLAGVSPVQGLEIVFRPDPSAHDGRFANNAWLMELPRPMTKLTWDNAAHVSIADAAVLGVETGDVVELSVGGRSVRAPVWILPGQAPGSVTVHLGYGRTRGGKLAVGAGFDANRIRTSAALWHTGGLTIRKLDGEKHEFAVTQGHSTMEGRDLVRSARFGEHEPGGHEGEHEEHESLYPDHPYPKYAWAMAFDLAACIGCNACVVACHAENNVPVVGKEQVQRGREMQWIRVDRYYEGPLESPTTHFQPIPCMQCEQAPCEVVCPVQATTHSDEGLNDMAYNRCVGTKYCSNNCPYKVRRYNFFGFSVDNVFGLDMKAPSLRLLHNPDVTVRSYGVMEKCTYCVQRINYARVEAKKEERRIADGEVMTACQAVCPTRAITFGDKNDPKSAVAARRAEPRHYALLDELNTKPRTTYLASLRNPNPEIEG